jgi:hypothetical protein
MVDNIYPYGENKFVPPIPGDSVGVDEIPSNIDYYDGSSNIEMIPVYI